MAVNSFWMSSKNAATLDALPKSTCVSDGRSTAINQTPSIRILIVEDCAIQQTYTALLLRQLGHDVSIVNDGLEALSAVQLDRYDVILMDCQMPLMNGLAATRFIRKLARMKGQNLTIIGVTATDAPQDCFDAGMDDFVHKPVNKAILKTVLGRWIRQNTAHVTQRCNID